MFKLSSLVVVASIAAAAVADRQFTVTNNCAYTVWPAIFGSPASTQATGWEAAPGNTVTFTMPTSWSGRIWGRRDCDFSGGNTQPNSCAVGGCAGGLECSPNGGTGVPPATLAEWTLDASGTDWYDISNVDGADLQMAISIGGNTNCTQPSCTYDLVANCPSDIAVQSGGANVGCGSPCNANSTSAATCPQWDYYHNNCPQVYAYAYDDNYALFTCPSASATSYTLTFCP
ncbi:Osmotin, thaumatin-like protein [Dentipellis sp. KUC8613]|nr:Osmotin, thaumatin-like protein [Dentipellis sp. KUC8613]